MPRLSTTARRSLYFLIGSLAMAGSLAFAWQLPSLADLGPDGDFAPTAYMRASGCAQIERHYRPLREIDGRLGCTAVWAEDGYFFRHAGVDWDELWHVARESAWAGRILGGASTIPMQLARNLHLSSERSLGRKLAEMLLARRLVARYERLRLLEVYLNAVEWAPCVYGAEAATQHYFGHSAEQVSLAEATYLLALLPRPSRAPGSLPDDRSQLPERQRKILGQLMRSDLVSTDARQRALARIEARWQSGWQTGRAEADDAPPDDWYGLECGTR